MKHLLKRSDGSSILELALLMPVLLLMLVGAVDFGRAYYVAIEVNSAAHAAALYGAQNFTDTEGMKSVAKSSAADVSKLTATASYGCECYDSKPTDQSQPCEPPANPCGTGNLLFYVQVNTAATYTPILKYPNFAALTLNGQARMRASY